MGKQLWLASIAFAVIGSALAFQENTISAIGRVICVIGILGIIVGLSIYAFTDAFFILITQPKKVAWKLIKTIGVFLFVMGLVFATMYMTGWKGEKPIITVAAFSLLAPIWAIWKELKTVSIECPQCGKKLYGATEEMIGEIGVCKKCKAEFTIKQEDTESKDE